MGLPVVALVGRPNVGKSALFNRLIGRRLAIVDETPGLTRDRLYGEYEWNGKRFLLVDTGGLVSGERETLRKVIREQTLRAIHEADVLVFVVDADTGPLPEDDEAAALLRESRKPVLVAANKADNPLDEAAVYEFHRLGMGDPLPVSAIHGHGTGDLLDEITALLPKMDEEPQEDAAVRVAVVGRPNVGKSSLVNAILGEERVIVAAEPGTTRDAVDTPLQYRNRPFILIDTAGLRRQARVEERVERYSVTRARRAIERADVVVLVLDASAGVTDQDQRIARDVIDAGRAMVVALNKWDLVDAARGAELRRVARHALRFVAFAPVLEVSAKEGRGVSQVLEAAAEAAESFGLRIPTGPLNRAVQAAEEQTPPPADPAGRRAKIFYATQAQARPPTIVLFVNDPELIPENYLRYLERALRREFVFRGTPVRFVLRARGRRQAN